MKLQVQFKHIEQNKKLTEHAEEKLKHLDKFEMKPSEVKLILSAKHHECYAEVSFRAPDHLYFRATALGEDHYIAMERALNKLEKQLSKHKGKVQFHKKTLFSHEGKLAQTNNRMEFHIKQRSRKGNSRAA